MIIFHEQKVFAGNEQEKPELYDFQSFVDSMIGFFQDERELINLIYRLTSNPELVVRESGYNFWVTIEEEKHLIRDIIEKE